jgi:hypothetical protein
MVIKNWEARIKEAYPDSDPPHWLSDLILKYVTAELADLRTKVASQQWEQTQNAY